MQVFHTVADGKVYRGPRPQSADDIHWLKNIGIKTILNLESGIFEFVTGTINEEMKWCIEQNVELQHFQIFPLCPPSSSTLDLLLKFLVDPTNLPVYVHCKEGVDRTGFTIAAYERHVMGKSYPEVKKNLLQMGFHTYRYWWWLPFLDRYCKTPRTIEISSETI